MVGRAFNFSRRVTQRSAPQPKLSSLRQPHGVQMFGNFFGGGGGGYYDKEYMERIQRERAERQARMEQEQRTIDAETDPTKRLALCRARYRCGEDFATLDDMVRLTVLLPQLQQLPNFTTVAAAAPSAGGGRSYYSMPNDTVTFTPLDGARRKPVDVRLVDKISIFRGDITALELDAIVNAANSSLMGGGGIDGAIHSAAGPLLGEECRTLHGCKTGNTKITKGYCLPAKHVLHTVGPIGRGDQKLRGCYRTCLDLVKQHKLRSVAFCCVSTGIFGFPLVRATHIALSETRKWLEEIAAVPSDDPDAYTLDSLDRIVFCVFKATELECYERIAPSYFPIESFPAAAVPEGEPTDPYQLDDASPDDDYDDDDAMAYPPAGGRGSGGGSSSVRFVGRGYPGAAGGAARY